MRRLHYLAAAAATLGCLIAWWMLGSGEYGLELLWWPVGLAVMVYLFAVVIAPFIMPEMYILEWLNQRGKKNK